MVQLIESKRQTGVFLTVLGVGEGNLQAAKMEKLADRGNGNYAYLDNILEARKVLVHELGGTLYTIAKDVKIQVEWNPARVRAYRLIGYENRMLRNQDFTDDKKDAGEVGSGHSVTALYEIVLVGTETDVNIRMPDSLRYQQRTAAPSTAAGPELLFVKVRYKAPDGDQSRRNRPLPEHEAAAQRTEDRHLADGNPETGTVGRLECWHERHVERTVPPSIFPTFSLGRHPSGAPGLHAVTPQHGHTGRQPLPRYAL